VRALRVHVERGLEAGAVGLIGQVGQAGQVGRVGQVGSALQITERDALRDTQLAFDDVAADYDASNAGNRLLCAMRNRVRAVVEQFVPPGSHMLDLGCGPGADAEYFGQRGDRITAIDWSPAMVRAASERVQARRLDDRVIVQGLGIHELDRLGSAAFDAVYSNFGPLNCVPDLTAAARAIAGRLRPDGVLIASVIGRTCPWELALYVARGDWTRAGVRYRPGLVPVPLGGRTVWTRYYAPRSFQRAFTAAGFARVALRALGLCAPPPYLQAFADRHPRLVAALERLDDWIGGTPPFRNWGDHFLIVLRKQPVSGQRAEG
jgi:SAM-dependent methyltransferase